MLKTITGVLISFVKYIIKELVGSWMKNDANWMENIAIKLNILPM